jgi:alpha-1,3-glucosyltransferase
VPSSHSQYHQLNAQTGVQPIYLACISLHIVELFLSPPSRYPDLFSVTNVLISTPVFGLIWLWSIKCGIQVSWALGGLGGETETTKARRPSIAASDMTDFTAHPMWTSPNNTRGGRAMSVGSDVKQSKKRRSFRAKSIGQLQYT